MTAAAADTVLFYALGLAAVVLAALVVSSRRLLRAGLFLMSMLVISAGLYVMLNAEFLAGVQVLVYVGGIMVLIVFAVMLTAPAALLEDHPALRRRALAALASLAFLALTGFVFATGEFAPARLAQRVEADTQLIGRKFLDQGPGGYVLPFVVVSVLLLTAAIGGIVVARKAPAPRQPFTSGGDLPGEADFAAPRGQREPRVENNR